MRWRHCSNSPTPHQRHQPVGQRSIDDAERPKRLPRARQGAVSPPGGLAPSSRRSGVSRTP
eukprot:2716997-Amphidinium_carterae.2